MRGLLIVARRQAASLRRSLPDSPLRGLYGALPWTSASQLACAKEEGREHVLSAFTFHGGPAGVRTLDLGIKSPLLCQLSYRSVTAKKDYTRNRRALQQENGVGKGIRTLDLQSHNLAR